MVSFRFFSHRKVDNTTTQQTPKEEVQDGAAPVARQDVCNFHPSQKKLKVNYSSFLATSSSCKTGSQGPYIHSATKAKNVSAKKSQILPLISRRRSSDLIWAHCIPTSLSAG